MSEAQKKANSKYEKKRQAKRVSFNPETEKELLDFADSVDFSNWVKQKIKDELNVTN
ncbi:hypothetical protein QSV37_05260 [Acinetobacter sp. VNK23]|uniref:hypothetical protein n=1 Tax=Acinetobacter thutiue TaxID=2998078 RepID=UPI002575AFE5|nr:hypothetical protein [Acinetobacter thutiue]MDM1019721.1 hypothetical protein [Acinetobacter thutiue]